MRLILYHGLNYTLAALMYTLIGRFILMFFIKPSSQNYIFRAFVAITDPVLRAMDWFIPAIVPPRARLVGAFLWLMIFRAAAVVLIYPGS